VVEKKKKKRDKVRKDPSFIESGNFEVIVWIG
jgi:hypothetical protein